MLPGCKSTGSGSAQLRFLVNAAPRYPILAGSARQPSPGRCFTLCVDALARGLHRSHKIQTLALDPQQL
jgi:hypothetical protein